MKKTLLILIAVSLVVTAYPQKRKYADEFPMIMAQASSGRTVLLKEFLVIEPDNYSLNFQLGAIYYERFKQSDILLNYAYKAGNAREALKYLKLSSTTVTEKDVKKNADFYANFGTYDDRGRLNVSYDTINSLITQAIPELELFLQHAPNIYEQFTKSFSHYDAAHKLYVDLLRDYTTEKDLFLLYGDEMDEVFERMKTEYQNSLVAFDAYKDAIQAYPINYDQNMVVDKISTYRLQGLEAEISFLKPEIDVWDYATWVDETRAYIAENITKLRTALLTEDKRLKSELDKASTSYKSESFKPLKVSKEVLFTLRKFDLNSVIEPLFLYQEIKQDLQVQKLKSEDMQNDASIDDDRKLYLYGQILNKYRNADSLLSDVSTRNVALTHRKYPEFLINQYFGAQGIEKFYTAERTANRQDFENYVSTVRSMLYEKLDPRLVVNSTNYKGQTISLVPETRTEDELIEPGYLTTERSENFDGSAFIGGLKSDGQMLSSFVCGVTPDGKVAWYQEYALAATPAIEEAGGSTEVANTRMGALQSVPGGCMLILNASDVAGSATNYLIKLDEGGNETLNKPLQITDYPRSINYNETANSIFVTFKGTSVERDIRTSSELVVAYYNILGDLQWQQRAAYKGDVIGVLTLRGGYAVVGNYNELQYDQGQIKRAGLPTETRAFMLTLNPFGEKTGLQAFETPEPYFVNKIYKVSDDCINLFGSKGNYSSSQAIDSNEETALHMIVNTDLEVLSTTM